MPLLPQQFLSSLAWSLRSGYTGFRDHSSYKEATAVVKLQKTNSRLRQKETINGQMNNKKFILAQTRQSTNSHHRRIRRSNEKR